MFISTNVLIIVLAFAIAVIAIYILYSIILFQGTSGKGDELQLSTKNILDQVDVLFEKGEYPLVELLGTKYLDRVPEHTDVRVYVAKAYYEDKKYNQAIKHCSLILKKRPNNIETHELLGKCYIKKQLLAKAIKEYEYIYEKDKADKNVVRTLAELYRDTDQIFMSISAYGVLSELLTTDDDIAEVQLIIAELNVEVHDYPAAFEAYKTRLGIYPKDIGTNKRLTELYIKISNYQAAIETLLYMLSFVNEPKDLLWVYETIVDLYEVTEDYASAVEYSEKLLSVQGADTFKVRNRIASLNIKLGKLNDGILILEDLALMSQNSFDIATELAAAYMKNNDYQKALDRYTILLDKATPREAKQVNILICNMYIDWAVHMREENKYEASFECLKNAQQYNPIEPEIFYNVAQNNLNKKNYTGAVESVNKALEFDKTHENYIKYYLLLAEAHHNLGNIFEEKKALSDLLNIDGKNAQGLLRMGILYASQHDVKNAEESLKEAIKYDPELIQAKYNLALIYENNNRDRAKELYMEVLEQEPTNEDAKRALSELTSTDF